MKLNRYALLGFILCSLVFSCTKDKKPTPLPVTVLTSDCDSTKVLFCNSIKAIINANCASSNCHVSGGTGPGDFSSYAGVKAKVDNSSFRLRVLDRLDMPPRGNPALSASETSLISQWLNEGAKEK